MVALDKQKLIQQVTEESGYKVNIVMLTGCGNIYPSTLVSP